MDETPKNIISFSRLPKPTDFSYLSDFGLMTSTRISNSFKPIYISRLPKNEKYIYTNVTSDDYKVNNQVEDHLCTQKTTEPDVVGKFIDFNTEKELNKTFNCNQNTSPLEVSHQEISQFSFSSKENAIVEIIPEEYNTVMEPSLTLKDNLASMDLIDCDNLEPNPNEKTFQMKPKDDENLSIQSNTSTSTEPNLENIDNMNSINKHMDNLSEKTFMVKHNSSPRIQTNICSSMEPILPSKQSNQNQYPAANQTDTIRKINHIYNSRMGSTFMLNETLNNPTVDETLNKTAKCPISKSLNIEIETRPIQHTKSFYRALYDVDDDVVINCMSLGDIVNNS